MLLQIDDKKPCEAEKGRGWEWRRIIGGEGERTEREEVREGGRKEGREGGRGGKRCFSETALSGG